MAELVGHRKCMCLKDPSAVEVRLQILRQITGHVPRANFTHQKTVLHDILVFSGPWWLAINLGWLCDNYISDLLLPVNFNHNWRMDRYMTITVTSCSMTSSFSEASALITISHRKTITYKLHHDGCNCYINVTTKTMS